jgi:hypothetical protein
MENEIKNRRKRRSRAYWEAQVENWRGSGLTRAEYCRREGINPQQLTNWKSRIGARAQAGAFVELPLPPASAAGAPSASIFELRVADDWSVTLAFRLPGFLRGASGDAI